MSHDTIEICAEHKYVQKRCKCPEPIKRAIEVACRHGELTDQSLFWDAYQSKIVRGKPVDPFLQAEIEDGIEDLVNTIHEHNPGNLHTDGDCAECDKVAASIKAAIK